ncbi:hypothetical protein EZV62_006775 [Acer yangbiense]|uniref:Uncharacterized protein n=1 Tax=Acer yangbiense TaxID=1000413 RepID=A0A5C7I828_9ROSI|nr:hypothetical protein EZV62_006775 [Acer yangbiense]
MSCGNQLWVFHFSLVCSRPEAVYVRTAKLGAMQMQSRVKMQNQMHIQRLGDDGTPFWLPVVLAYYRGAMGILLVNDVTDESSFNSNSHSLPCII